MSVVLVRVRCRPHPLQETVQTIQAAAQPISPSNSSDTCKTPLKRTVCKGYHSGVREGLIHQG